MVLVDEEGLPLEQHQLLMSMHFALSVDDIPYYPTPAHGRYQVESDIPAVERVPV